MFILLLDGEYMTLIYRVVVVLIMRELISSCKVIEIEGLMKIYNFQASDI